MSVAQQRRMSMSANARTFTENERAARRLIEATDCPLCTVVARSGAPSTENVFICEWSSPAPSLWGWTPECNSCGRKDGCPLLKRLVERKDWANAATVRLIQVRDVEAYQRVVYGSVAGWELRPEYQEVEVE